MYNSRILCKITFILLCHFIITSVNRYSLPRIFIGEYNQESHIAFANIIKVVEKVKEKKSGYYYIERDVINIIDAKSNIYN